MPIGNAYSGKVDFKLFEIKYEPDGNGPSEIKLEYARPSIGIDNKGRFVTHEIIGGTTVRQKIGEEPREMSITGVIKSDKQAKNLDKLRDAKSAKVSSNRLPGKTMKCQIPSVSTSPISDGGGVMIEDGKFLYNFKMKLVELTLREEDSSSSSDSGSSTVTVTQEDVEAADENSNPVSANSEENLVVGEDGSIVPESEANSEEE